jgi:hypothetical protein
VAELDGDCLKGWPMGMRLIVRKERPHPGAQLRFTDADGMRLTCFAINTAGEAIAALELRHRQRARAEDRIRAARATGRPLGKTSRPARCPRLPGLQPHLRLRHRRRNFSRYSARSSASPAEKLLDTDAEGCGLLRPEQHALPAVTIV